MLSLNKKILIYLIFFGSLIASIILGENSSGGAEYDYLITKKYIETFQLNLNEGIELFKKDNQGHLPFFYILIANLNNLFGEKFVNYLYLVISSLIPFVFYNVLKKNFSKKNDNVLFLLSLIIFLSPYFRSSTVWITTDNLALLFFLLSINSFLSTRIDKKNYLKNSFLCFFFLILASYIRQSYALFFILYFISIQSKLKLLENFYILIFNFLLSIPALIWIFIVFKFEGIQSGYYWTSNIFINILVFTSLFFFYFFPFVLNKYSLRDFIKKMSDRKFLLMVFFSLALSILIFFNIPILSHGGGVFYKISKITNLNFITVFSILGFFVLICFNDLVKKNYLIYLILIFSYPFIYVYQKYYDPLIFIVILSLVESKFIKDLIENNKINIYLVLMYFFLFLAGSNLYYI